MSEMAESGTHPLGPQVLLVEDDRDDALLIRRAFRKAGLALPTHVEDGEAAVAYLARCAIGDQSPSPLPALVLLDLKLPRKSGLEVLAWLRGLRRAYDLGANSYLVKPVGFEALRQLVETLGLYWLTLNEPPDTEG
jgi:DNA-binding response OmpR family regulator